MVHASAYDEFIYPEAREALKPDPKVAEEDILPWLEDQIERRWGFYYVTNIMDTNSAILLMHIARSAPNAELLLAQHIQRYVDVLAELIHAHDSLAGLKVHAKEGSEEYDALVEAGFMDFDDKLLEHHACNIVRYFLYSAWSRSVVLLFYLVAGQQLEHGASRQWSKLLAVRGLDLLSELDGRQGGHEPVYRAGRANDYICGWSVELLRRSRPALCLDFRTLWACLRCFKGNPGRCSTRSTKPCDGSGPSSCDRFTQATTKPQTAHAISCIREDCHLVKWDRDSYMAISGARAVAVEQSTLSNGTRLQYMRASENTMAISHVWAHGQGGRPEDGINICLHRRYISLAGRFGCDSYWIDSACIPSEHSLRKEAILYINSIFGRSKAVIISDKDVQQIPIKDIDCGVDVIWQAQVVLSTLLICDWNVRAWTLLEAYRGNRSIHLLCQADETVSLLGLLKLVWATGSMDLAILVASSEHLVPFAEGEDCKTIEEAATMLSLRHASRAGDDVIIWSLLNSRTPTDDPLVFWRATKAVNTAFLLSTAPRLRDSDGRRIRGFSWAPASPNARLQTREALIAPNRSQRYTIRHQVYDGNGSCVGAICDKGLTATWRYHDLTPDVIKELLEDDLGNETYNMDPEDWEMQYGDQLHDEEDTTGMFHSLDVPVYCREAMEALRQGRQARLLRAASDDDHRPYQATADRGDDFGPAVALVFSNDDGRSWVWQDVYQCVEDPYWRWEKEELLIV